MQIFLTRLFHVSIFVTVIENHSYRTSRASLLSTAKDFRIVQKKVAELIKGRILVGHALRNDLKVSGLLI